MFVVSIAGSPNISSNSTALLAYAHGFLAKYDISVVQYSIHDFAPEDILHANFASETLLKLQKHLDMAQGVLIATPVYKASFSGVLKSILDLLPQDALADKIVLPFACAGSMAHLLALDYALKPVLSVMKASKILTGVFAQDNQIDCKVRPTQFDAALSARLDSALTQFTYALSCPIPIAQEAGDLSGKEKSGY